MRPALKALLDRPIDYAGLFPPAKLDLPTALQEYVGFDAEESLLVDRFICPANKLTDFNQLLRESGDDYEPIDVTVVGSAIENGHGSTEQFQRDCRRMDEADLLNPTAYEVRCPSDHHVHSVLKAVSRSSLWDLGLDVYLEFPWGDGMEEAIHEATHMMEDVGFKARTGGITPDAFPSVSEVADFIYLVASLEIPFKFTAGLHEPLRYEDKDLGVYRHGFLNVMIASALAFSSDLTKPEIERILEITSPTEIVIGDDIQVAGHILTLDDIQSWWGWFGGFGSCSVAEPIAGLKRLGYWDA
ncbi:hypothetical protein QPK87_10075 [Kamptonema cortianum]|nr:hypothetical protein [Geitlerinema splendidum]MDK3156923.1 hypothetical protein [Kamptonema cortianum]